MDYNELAKSLRICANEKDCVGCKEATDLDESGIDKFCMTGDTKMVNEAADAIENLSNYEALYRDLTDKGMKTIRELLDKYPKWISSEERLPEKPGMYLVWIHEPTDVKKDDWMADYNYGYVDLLQYDIEQGLWQNEPYEAYNAHLEFVDKVNGFYVSHWMEKPVPPKEETE